LIYDIKDYLSHFFQKRLYVLAAVMFLLFTIIVVRVFSLQIVNGQMYQDNFVMLIEKPLIKEATRGNIYDCNGILLAYNELAYSVTISDSGSYRNERIKGEVLNPQLAEIVQMLHKNEETLYNEFKISYVDGKYEFNVSGSKLKRFLADAFGKSSYDSLKYDEKYGFNQATASAEQVMTYLKDAFYIDDSYDEQTAYDIVVVRYAMKSMTYTRYQPVVIAQDVSDKTVAYVKEHLHEYEGIAIEEDMIRKYNDSIYFASLIGYTGKISDAEYAELFSKDESYETDDTI
jgi:penicillin-binding protein 2